jgi:MscS family membrane protein
MKKGWIIAKWFGVLVLAGCCTLSFGAPLPLSSPPSASQPGTLVDPLYRNTPRSTLLRFMEAAQKENYPLASSYLLSPQGGMPSRLDEERVRQIKSLLDYNFVGQVSAISNEPVGQMADGLPPNLEKAGEIQIAGQKYDLMLVRIDYHDLGKIWLISTDSLRSIPELAEINLSSRWESRLPRIFVEWRFLNLPLWQWMAFVLLLPLTLALAWILVILIRLALLLYFRIRSAWTKREVPESQLFKRPGPGIFLLALYLFYLSLKYLGVPLIYRYFFNLIFGIPVAIGVYWLLCRLIDWGSDRIEVQVEKRKHVTIQSLMLLIRRFVKVLLFLIIFLLLLKSFGVNVDALLAGLGIGGLVLGLGAQKTLENVFGGISILGDRCLRVGDVGKVGDVFGLVEDIGFRSIQIRTLERTVVTIPNGMAATSKIENFSNRDKILFKHVVTLRYETTFLQKQEVLRSLRSLLNDHPLVESDTARANFIRLGSSSMEVEVQAYILTTDFLHFLEVQEELLDSFMELVEKAGTQIAFPSQTIYVEGEKSQGQKG